MTGNIQLTLHITDPTLDAEEQETVAQRLLAQMKDMDEIEWVRRQLDPNPPDRSKMLAGTLIGLLTVEVSRENLLKVMRFLGDRLGNKQIELEIEVDGRKLKIIASSREELELAAKTAQDFMATKSNDAKPEPLCKN
jgi:hypothetical protein